MKLSPRERDKLLISMAAMVAQNRKERGVKLNYPEAIALISDFVVEGARDGRPAAHRRLGPIHALRVEDVQVGQGAPPVVPAEYEELARLVHLVRVRANARVRVRG